MIGLMIVPLPTFLLDIFLTINITVAVTILMVSIYISSPTQIASFPTLLLITTLYRLSLDISATRLILLKARRRRGHPGIRQVRGAAATSSSARSSS